MCNKQKWLLSNQYDRNKLKVDRNKFQQNSHLGNTILQSSYTENVKPLEDESNLGELAQFLMKYLEQVESLLQLISACRSGDWEGYLAALENNIKYFFAHDHLNYARLMPVHLAQIK